MFLQDNYINKSTQREIFSNSVYEFSIDKLIRASFGSSRLVLIIKPDECFVLNSFTATAINNFSHLKWIVEKKINVGGFEIERSSDDKTFSMIGEVKINALNPSANYNFIDKSPLPGANYYRLKKVLKNNQKMFSNSVLINMDLKINLTGNDFTIQVYPNPSSSEIFVNLNLENTASSDMSIFDVKGKRIQKINFPANSIIKSNVSLLKEGLYFLEIRSSRDNRIIGQTKFYKN